jgi:hypothetical protein
VINIIIYTPPEDHTQHAPLGFIFTNELFAVQKLKDPISDAQQLSFDLIKSLSYLKNRYPKRLRIRFVNPWSLLGLWVAFRFRLRSFPAVILNRDLVLTGEEIKSLDQHVANMLSHPTNSVEGN